MLRLFVGGGVAAMMAVHVDDILIVGPQEVADNVIYSMLSTSGFRLKLKESYPGTWAVSIGGVDRRVISRITKQYIRSAINLFHVSKSSSIPAHPSRNLGYTSEEETVVEEPPREVVGSLMEITSQTKPGIANAVWAVPRFFHDPEDTHWKAARKILEYLRAADLLGLTFYRDSKLKKVRRLI